MATNIDIQGLRDSSCPPIGGTQVEMWPIDRFVFYARNPRKNDAAVDRMCASIREFGFKIPVLARSDGTVVDGHLRLKAARKLGSWPGGDVTGIPVILCDEWTSAQVKAFRLMVNRSVTWAGWDEELLALELQELNEADFDLSLTGFDPTEIDRFMATENAGLTDEDAVPEPPANPVTVPGDLWLLGEDPNQHRVLAGDATKAGDVQRLLTGHKEPFLMVTDPPYGTQTDPEWRSRDTNLQKTTRLSGTVANDDRADWTPAWQLFPGDVAYIWHAGVRAAEAATSLLVAGFIIRAKIIWKKQRFVISRGAYHWGHEPAWYSVREGKTAHWRGDRTQSTVWEVDNLVTTNRADNSQDPENAITGHGMQKPAEIMRRPIVNHTVAGEAIYDPFLGSGSTLIACQSTERICYGIDIDPKYVDCAVVRWQEYSGKFAVLSGDGRSFDEIAQQRRQEAA
jgi:DNA modification methylase/ParB-like chromosome segregation protein Spo0J